MSKVFLRINQIRIDVFLAVQRPGKIRFHRVFSFLAANNGNTEYFFHIAREEIIREPPDRKGTIGMGLIQAVRGRVHKGANIQKGQLICAMGFVPVEQNG